MGTILCVWWPEWSLRRPDASPDRPCFVVQAGSGGSRVVAANSHAKVAGIELGMPGKEAEGLSPNAVVLERDLSAETLDFEPVVAAIEDIVPKVEVVEPGLVFVPVDGEAGAVVCVAREESATPWMLAPTAAPTRQSSQWLSGRVARSFHSSTVRSRAIVLTRNSAVRCSANSRCCAGFPKSERQPLSPIATARRAWMNDFQ